MGLGDFKRVACAVKSLLKLEKLESLPISVATQPQIEDVSGPVAQHKKTAPKGGLKGVLQRGLGLEVDAAARVDQVEVVDRHWDVLQLSAWRNRGIACYQAHVGVKVLIGKIEVHGSGFEALIQGQEPTIDL